MKSSWIMVAVLCAASVGAQSQGWEATAGQRCIPDIRPAEDTVELQGAAYDVVKDDELTLAIDGDADGRGDRLLRVRPEHALDLDLLRGLVAGARRFEFYRRAPAAPAVRLVPFGGRAEAWLVLRSSECPLPASWLNDRDVVMLDSLIWIRTPDGPELATGDRPDPEALVDAYSVSEVPGPSACRAGGPGALSCGLTDGEASCFAACPSLADYACCAATACGCVPVGAGGD